MTDLTRLTVSLTKHNSHKVARLLKKYRADQVLSRLEEVHAELAQAKKNLSILPGDKVPPVWEKAKRLGHNAIDALVFVGIVFSHHELIKTMQSGSTRGRARGRVTRGQQLGGKAYTNFARVVDQLGFVSSLDESGFTFDLRSILEIAGLGALVRELLRLKLTSAGWNGAGSVEDEAVRHSFQKVFGISEREFRLWLDGKLEAESLDQFFLRKDQDFFEGQEEYDGGKDFVFKPGHVERSVEPITKKMPQRSKVVQLHNEIQNRLYLALCSELGPSKVGTEIETGNGTYIDVVTVKNSAYTFYEIKTGPSVRSNIRQAIPQLLEYSYWPREKRAKELVIVSHLSAKPEDETYLVHLRSTFGLPLSYRQFDLTAGKLK